MFRSASNFDKLLDKATSNLKLEPDWPTILKICDLIRQGDVQPKYALAAIKKKMFNENPHTALFGLMVLESCVKNCGSLIHDEIGTANYMTQLRELIKTSTQENIRNKVLELIQAWAFAFRNAPKYRAVLDMMNILKAEDFKFPALKESDAMFSADTAPEWADGECCHRCRVQFGMVQRKHHCRACGQVFCSQCSSKSCTLPKFGIEKEVRVCDACFNNNSKSTKTTPSKADDLPAEYLNSSLAQQNQAPPPRKSEEELREEEELQLALALSQSEAEQKDKQKMGQSSTLNRAKTYSPPPTVRTSSPPEEEVDPELARYLNRSYWENRQLPDERNSPSAPASLSSPMPATTVKQTNATVEQNGVESDSQMEEFVHALQSQVEIFINRMKSNSSRGRSITNDSSVQTLFMNITAMHSKLLRYIQQQDDSRVYYEGLQDKLAQVKDARAALNALREEHREKLRREAEMAERQRQMQMAQKLDIMRKKKQEYLQYQRQLALQRIQEQEREMQMRQEQQKQQYLIGTYNSLGYIPPGPNFDNQGIPNSGGMVMPPPHHPGFPPAPMSAGYAPFPPPTSGMPGQPLPPPPMMGPGPHPPHPYMIGPGSIMPSGIMGPPSQMHGLPPQNQPPGVQPQIAPPLNNQGLPPMSQPQHIPPGMVQQQQPPQMNHIPQNQPQISQSHPSLSSSTSHSSISASNNQNSHMMTAPTSQTSTVMPPPTSQSTSMMPPIATTQSTPMVSGPSSQNPPIMQSASNSSQPSHMVAGAPPMMMPPHLAMPPHPQTFQPQPPIQQQPPPQALMQAPQQQPPIQEQPSQLPETAELISFD